MAIRDDLVHTINNLTMSTPILDFKFGHTKLQIEHFQIVNQKGNAYWEYWQHLLQLKALYATLRELLISYDETTADINDCLRLWPICSYRKRKRKYPRLEFKLECTTNSILEKSREVSFHLDVINKNYAHLLSLTEDDILNTEIDYWSLRLSRQLSAGVLSRQLNIPESEILVILSLPLDQQKHIFSSMQSILNTTVPLITKG